MPRATFTALSFLRVLVASTREVRVRVSTMMPPVARSEAMASRNAAVSTESATPMFGAASAKNAAFSTKTIEVRAARLRSPFVSGLGDASSGKSSAMARRRAIFSCASRVWGLGAGIPASGVPGFGVVEDIGYLRMLLSHPFEEGSWSRQRHHWRRTTRVQTRQGDTPSAWCHRRGWPEGHGHHLARGTVRGNRSLHGSFPGASDCVLSTNEEVFQVPRKTFLIRTPIFCSWRKTLWSRRKTFCSPSRFISSWSKIISSPSKTLSSWSKTFQSRSRTFSPRSRIFRAPAEIFQNPDEGIETPGETKPPEDAITPRERGGFLLETELTPLERELAPPPAAGMPPPLDLTPAAADLPLALADAQPESGRLAVELREGTLAALDRTPASSDLELLSIGVDSRTCSRIHNRRFPMPVKIRSIGTAIRQTFFEGLDRLQTGHDSPPFLDIPLRRRSPAEVTGLWQAPGNRPWFVTRKRRSADDADGTQMKTVLHLRSICVICG